MRYILRYKIFGRMTGKEKDFSADTLTLDRNVVSVFVDGTLVDKSNYTLESGSTILTFTPRYYTSVCPK